MSKSPSIQPSVMDSTGHFDVKALLAETLAGKDPEQAAYGQSGTVSDKAAQEFNEEVAEDTLETMAAESADNQESSEPSEESESAELSSDELLNSIETPKKGKEDIEQVTLKFKDPETGRQQKIKIDYNDREGIKKAFMQAAGMRKFQQERDKARKEHADIQSKYTELNDVYTKLDEAFTKDGVKGVVQLLSKGNKNAWDEAVNKELQRREYLSNLTPTEKYRMEMEEKQKEYETQLASERARREEFEKRVSEREEQASLKSLESKLHPAFDRYRFTGKLGDPVVEHQFDEAVWNKVMQRLAEYPDEMELTQALIDKEFREVTNNFRKSIKMQTEKSVKKTIEQKKVDASQRAQVAAKKGLSTNSDKRKFVEDIKSGNIQDAFKAMFSGKVKI